MSSTASATLATWFKIHGVNYSISSACSTSAAMSAPVSSWVRADLLPAPSLRRLTLR
ncbi:MAG: beta-ketoacyl synthase N-terminal-like domain-containing protein [Agrobacterium vaccinii]